MNEADLEEIKKEEKQQIINKPYTEEELERKVAAVRADVSNRLNKWTNKIIFAVSSGDKPHIKREEGEQWVEGDKTWVVKNGIRQTVSKLETARMPWWCPVCKKPMNHRFDRKFYYIRGWCYDCNINFEHQLRIVPGKWEAFERRKIKENEISIVKHDMQETVDYLKTFTEPKIYFENGGYEVLATKAQFKSLFDELEKKIEQSLEKITILEQELKEEIENAI